MYENPWYEIQDNLMGNFFTKEKLKRGFIFWFQILVFLLIIKVCKMTFQILLKIFSWKKLGPKDRMNIFGRHT